MLAVQVGSLFHSYEELGAIRPLASIGHAEQSRLLVLDSEVFILELLAVDGLATGAITIGEVAALAHELGDDTVEGAILVVERLARLAIALVSGTQRAEVFGCLGHLVAIQTKYYSPRRISSNGDVEEALVCDGLITWHILCCDQILPHIPLALLHDADDNTASILVLLNLPRGILRIAFFGERVIYDGRLTLETDLQSLLRELEVNVFGFDCVRYWDENLDLLLFVIIASGLVPIILACLDRHGEGGPREAMGFVYCLS
mmetsp:Transcript_18988/g.34278  ORF Transcript_18988/g.34278 Transcript_18988/m.34278 type:complete len:260 (+) Transcript_18988:210-989(+)